MFTELEDGSLTTRSPGKFRQLDFCGHTFNSYMIDIVFLDIFQKYLGIQIYLTATYCLRYANYPLYLKGFQNERDSIFRDPTVYWRKSIITVIIILILIKYVLSSGSVVSF